MFKTKVFVTIDIASSSAVAILFKASCAASLACHIHHQRNQQQRKNLMMIFKQRSTQKKKREHGLTWRDFTRVQRGGKLANNDLTASSGGFVFLKQECFSSFSAVGLFVWSFTRHIATISLKDCSQLKVL